VRTNERGRKKKKQKIRSPATYPVGGGYFDDQVDGFGAEKPSVAAHHHGRVARGRRLHDGAEHGLHEVLRVVGQLKHFDGFAQPAGARLLAVVRFRLDAHRNHRVQFWFVY